MRFTNRESRFSGARKTTTRPRTGTPSNALAITRERAGNDGIIDSPGFTAKPPERQALMIAAVQAKIAMRVACLFIVPVVLGPESILNLDPGKAYP
jgi:hypothetical protein